MSSTMRSAGLVGQGTRSRRPIGSTYRYRPAPGALRVGQVLLLCLVLLAVAASALASRRELPSSVPTVCVRVIQGENLWRLARQHPVAGLSTAQTADLIAEINDLEAGPVAVGSLVNVPARTSEMAILASR
jgi:hypothetical protein